MPERKEEAKPERSSAVVHHKPGTVVDRRYVVGVERMPNAQHVGNHAHAHICCPRWKRPRVGKIQAPTGDVEQEHASGDEEKRSLGSTRHVAKATRAQTACHVP